jgi:hypothetical protein
VDVAQRFQELRAFDGDLHCNIRPIQQDMSWECRAVKAPRPRGSRQAMEVGFRGSVKWRG